MLFGWAKKSCCVTLRVIKRILEKENVFSFLRTQTRESKPPHPRPSALERAFECARETSGDSVTILLCKFFNYIFLMFNHLNKYIYKYIYIPMIFCLEVICTYIFTFLCYFPSSTYRMKKFRVGNISKTKHFKEKCFIQSCRI